MAAWPVALSIGEAIGTTAMVFIALCLPWLVIRLYADVDEFFNRAHDQTALGKTETQADYRTLLGALMYFIIQTTANVTRQFMSNLKDWHGILPGRAFKYLRGIRNLDSCYSKFERELTLFAWIDDSWGKNSDEESFYYKWLCDTYTPTMSRKDLPFLPTPTLVTVEDGARWRWHDL